MFIIYIVSFSIPNFSWAEENTQEDASGGFIYEVLHPENQHSEAGYFDLRMKPKQKQTVQIKFSNTTDKEISVDVDLSSAKTNSNGVIEYGPIAIEKDASMKYDFTDIVKAPEKVTIPANSETALDLEITMPEEEFDGYVSGGIQFQKHETDEEKAAQTGTVINKFAYVVGMLLHETDTVIDPDITFNSVGPALQNYRNAFVINFSNTEAMYLDGMTVDARITKASDDVTLYDLKSTNMRMAPNSMIDIPVSLNGDRMTPGDYNAHVVVTSEAGGRWEWKQEFTVTDEEADKYNDQDVSLLQERGIDWKIIAAIVGGIILLILIIFLIIRQVNKKKEEQQKKKSNKRKKAKK